MSGDVALLRSHLARYPRMEAQDCVKLLYQSEFGPQHLGDDIEALAHGIAEEWKSVPDVISPAEPERIGGGLCRFPLRPGAFSEAAAQVLAKLVAQTARQCHGSGDNLRRRLEQLGDMQPDLSRWLAAHASACDALVHHSAAFRAAYHPHYRLLRQEFAAYFPLLLQIEQTLQQKKPLLIAIDGRCGSGKTQLAALMQAIFPCRVFHTDHYYLPVDRRPADWQQRPAGNMDLERLLTEVIRPAQEGAAVASRVFDCAAQRLGAPQTVMPAPLTVVEGSYALHPKLVDAYDLRVFLTCSGAEQAARLQAREGAYFEQFRQVWIPMEERYFAQCDPLACHPIQMDTTALFCESSDSLCI